MTGSAAAIVLSAAQGVDQIAYADAVHSFESAGLSVVVEQREMEIFASLQYLAPAALMAYILKPYTEKFLGKLAEDNYESCKAGFKFLWAKFAAKDRKLRSTFVASTEGKIADRTLSSDISFLAKAVDGQTFRLSFPQQVSEEEFQNTVHRFYGLMAQHDLILKAHRSTGSHLFERVERDKGSLLLSRNRFSCRGRRSGKRTTRNPSND